MPTHPSGNSASSYSRSSRGLIGVLRFLPILAIGLLLQGLAAAGTVFWSADVLEGDWNDPASWNGNRVPGTADDAVVSRPEAIIRVRRSAEVRNLTLAPGARLFVSGPDVRFSAGGTVAMDGVNLEVRDGAVVLLPGLSQYTAENPAYSNVDWLCTGLGSRLEVSGLGRFAGAVYPAIISVTVRDGGSMSFGKDLESLTGRMQFWVEGTNSIFLAPGIHMLSPKSFNFTVSAGARVSLPGLADWSGLQIERSSALWVSDGVGSLLDIPNLAEFAGCPDPWMTEIRAYNGGKINLGGSFSTVRGGISVVAQGPNSVIQAPGLQRLAADYSEIYGFLGGSVELPGLREYSGTNGSQGAPYFGAVGNGSLLDVSGLTNFVGSLPPWTTRVEVREGGRARLKGDFGIASGDVSLTARGTNSILEAPGLKNVSASYLDVEATEGGRVSLPAVKEIANQNPSRFRSYWICNDPGSVLELPALANFKASSYPALTEVSVVRGGRVVLGGEFQIPSGRLAITVSGSDSVLYVPHLTRIAASHLELYATGGAVVLLPGLTEWTAASLDRADGRLGSVGPGSRLELTSLTNLTGAPVPWRAEVFASGGGRVKLAGQFGVSAGGVRLASEGTNSLLEAPGLGILNANYSEILANQGGSIVLPNLREYSVEHPDRGVSYWTAEGTGSAVEVAGLKSFAGAPVPAAVHLRAWSGGRITLNGIFAVDRGDISFLSEGSGSVLEVHGLRRLAAEHPFIQASSGGRVSFVSLAEYVPGRQDRGNVEISSNGTGSVLEFSGMGHLVGSQYPAVTRFSAEAGGLILLLGVSDIVKGSVVFRSLGTNSYILAPELQRLEPEFFEMEVTDGSRVSLPSLVEWSGARIQKQSARWSCSGIGSSLDLPALTNWIGSVNPWRTEVSVQAGGHVSLRGKFGIPTGGIRLISQGAGSLLEAPGLKRLAAGAVDVLAENGGRISLSDLQEYSGENADRGPHYWAALGAGSGIELDGLKKFSACLYPAFTQMVSRNGGLFKLKGEFSVVHGSLALSSEGANSLLQATGLRRLAPESVAVTVEAGGQLLLADLREYDGSGILWEDRWESRGAGSLLEVSGLSRFVGADAPAVSNLAASSGGRFRLGGVFEIPSGIFSILVNGQGSIFEAPELTSLSPNYLDISVLNAGRTTLAGLKEFRSSNARRNGFNWISDGAGSVLEMPNLLRLMPPGDLASLSITARAGGLVGLKSVAAIEGGNLAVLADGAGSSVDLSSVSRFDTYRYNGSIRALNMGEIRLPSIFSTRGATLAGIRSWGLPEVSADGSSNEILCGLPGLAVVVEGRLGESPDLPWVNVGRVAMVANQVSLNNFFGLSGGVDLRVRELRADPPELESHLRPDGTVYLTVFGLKGSTYHLDGSPDVAPIATWSPFGRVALQHSFELVNLPQADGTSRFFRANRE